VKTPELLVLSFENHIIVLTAANLSPNTRLHIIIIIADLSEVAGSSSNNTLLETIEITSS